MWFTGGVFGGMSNIVFSHKLPSEAHNLTFYVIYTTTTTTTTTTLQKSGKKFTLPLQNTQKRTEKILKIWVAGCSVMGGQRPEIWVAGCSVMVAGGPKFGWPAVQSGWPEARNLGGR